MPTLKVVYKASTKEARVLDSGAATPSGFTAVGTFAHPDATYPDSVVIYHGVRDLLYKRSAANPANTAMFPDNITNMHEISITNLAVARLMFVRNLPKFKSVPVGTDTTLEVIMSGGKAPLEYRWYKDDVLISGATDSILEISNASAFYNGTIKCQVEDDNGTIVNSYECVVEVAESVPLTGLLATPNSVSLSVAADLAAGKDVVISGLPAGALTGNLSIKTAPTAGRATATVDGNTVNIKPVAAGAATSVVITNGLYDVTIAITVAE